MVSSVDKFPVARFAAASDRKPLLSGTYALLTAS